MKKIIFYISIILFTTLAILKINDVIILSWWWITAPIWIPFIIAVIVVIAFFILASHYSKNDE